MRYIAFLLIVFNIQGCSTATDTIQYENDGVKFNIVGNLNKNNMFVLRVNNEAVISEELRQNSKLSTGSYDLLVGTYKNTLIFVSCNKEQVMNFSGSVSCAININEKEIGRLNFK